MSGQLQQFFTAQALHFAEGRIEAMARPYLSPLPVSLDDRYYCLRRHDDVIAAFQAKREGVAAAGLKDLRIGVVEERLDRRDHAIACVDWFYFGGTGRREGRTRVRYFLGRRSGDFVVEMIEFVELAFPEVRNWYIAYAAGPLPRGRPLLH